VPEGFGQDRKLGWRETSISAGGKVAAAKRSAGASQLTIAPEFGPPPYLPTLPWTQTPVASQWDINVHMMSLLREHLAAAPPE
jgi:hypothetical protein